MVFYRLKKKKFVQKLNPKTWITGALLWLIQNVICKRPYDELVRPKYLERWYIIPRNRFLNIYYHKFIGNDGEVLHDHPWHSLGVILKGEYLEYEPFWQKIKKGATRSANFERVYIRTPGSITFRSGNTAHRVEILSNEVHTIFITGPKYKEWGFYTSSGWVHHLTYLLAQERKSRG